MSFVSRINKMSDDRFVKRYVLKKRKNVTITEKRHLIKNVMVNGSVVYFIHFEYMIVREKGFFDNNTYVVTKTVKDPVYFTDKKDADYYIKNAVCPSISYSLSYPVYMYRQIFIKEFFDNKYLDIFVNVHSKNSTMKFEDRFSDGYSHTFRSHDTLIKADNCIRDYFVNQYPVNTDILKTIEINKLCNFSESDKEQLKINIEKTKGPLQTIIVDEIDRTEKYLEVLKKLMN